MQVYNDGDELASIAACSHSAQLFCFVPRHVNVPPHVMKIDSAGNRVFFQKNKGYFFLLYIDKKHALKNEINKYNV